jgi:hypothetical protein
MLDRVYVEYKVMQILYYSDIINTETFCSGDVLLQVAFCYETFFYGDVL